MSFFDEADEPPVAPRAVPRRRRSSGTGRPSGGGRGPSGGGRGGSGGGRGGAGGRNPAGQQQSIQARRVIAAVVMVVLLILIVVGIHSCQVSARNSSLRDYANGISSLIQQSDQTGAQLFSQLSGGGGTNPNQLQTQINQTSVTADSQLSRAHGLAVPDEMRSANQNLVLSLEMRRDGIVTIAHQIQPALGTSTSKDAVNAIAGGMARFYASDVLYKGYTTPQVAAALHAAGIRVGGTDGVQIEAGQFLPDLQWLTPSFIASKLGAQSPSTPAGKPTPGLHGHSLDSVAVGATTLQSGSTNTVPVSPIPKFTLSLTNGGQNTERNVVCKVSVSGTPLSGQTTIPQTTAGQTTTCSVQLSAAPPPGSYTVTATVAPVPGEKSTTNNTLSFPVTFQ